MGAFTAQQIENIANAALDFHLDQGRVNSQTIQNKPLLSTLRAGQKTFPGGKGEITFRVKGEYTTVPQGYTNDDTVTYGNPGHIKTGRVPWKEIHSGISVPFTELKVDGITITNTTNGTGESMHSKRDMTVLANIFQDKLEDMTEGHDRGMNLMFWRDGTQSAKEVPGIRSFIVNDPTAATIVEGVDQSANTWWRNRASLAITASTASDNNVLNTFSDEYRQLRKFGEPKHRMFCGSDWLEWIERELRSKGNYTMTGWASKGRIDAGMADMEFKGVEFEYDPTLDDLSLAKYCFVLDMKEIYLDVMEGEDMKRHNPARPPEKYVLYRGLTWTGGLVCRRRNTSGVYSIA